MSVLYKIWLDVFIELSDFRIREESKRRISDIIVLS